MRLFMTVSIHTPHAGRDDKNCNSYTTKITVSIHAPRAGRDVQVQGKHGVYTSFNPRAPCGARLDISNPFILYLTVSIHAPHAGRDQYLVEKLNKAEVSIHAPRAGRDDDAGAGHMHYPRFNPRAPCGARRYLSGSSQYRRGFNPRAPCGARRTYEITKSRERRFNPRAPCGARQGDAGLLRPPPRFNPRAPCGARPAAIQYPGNRIRFQFTRPVRGATSAAPYDHLPLCVSIHAPHAGRDSRRFGNCTERRCFNPRAPCGVRLTVTKDEPSFYVFQSTRPMRGATFCIKKTTR